MAYNADGKVLSIAKVFKAQRQKPLYAYKNILYNSCSSCRYLNTPNNIFCTNCGVLLQNIIQYRTLYNIRVNQRKNLLIQGEKSIQQAKVVLYALSALCITLCSLIFSDLPERYYYTLLFSISGILYFILAQWSNRRPFTALAVAFIVVITSSLISVLSKFSQAFVTVNSLYEIIITTVVCIFLYKGIQGAYRVNLIQDEIEIK